MGTRDVLNYLQTEPFRPFRIHMVGGRNFDIRHPEMVKVGRTAVTIFTFVSDEIPALGHEWQRAQDPQERANA